jgi:hypothetical protein
MKEPEDVFFSKEQIEQSLQRLSELNPFFGITFLAFKEVDLPIGKTKQIRFSSTLEAFLQKYYRPANEYNGFYIPFMLSEREKRWKSYNYISTLLTMTNNAFSHVCIHPEGSNDWGWQSDYIEVLTSNPIPLFDLAVWLFRFRNWSHDTRMPDILQAFFTEFHVKLEEQKIFSSINTTPVENFLQETSIETEILFSIIGLPPPRRGEVFRNNKGKTSPYTSIPLFNSLSTLTEYGAKLQQLKLMEVGPAQELELDLAPRLNLITGDNALGKTFLLECAWWALTGTWASKYPALPRLNAQNPGIAFQVGKEYQPDRVQKAEYNWRAQNWLDVKDRNRLPGLSIFCQADGSFAVWDPARLDDTHKTSGETDALIRISPTEIWDGVRETRNNKIVVKSRGLIEDWLTWQTMADSFLFEVFCTALKGLSPHPQYPLVPGEPARIPDEERDVRSVPTLNFPYGPVPIALCSAGIKRIVALAYMLVWAWNEHVVNSEIIREAPQRSIVLLIDEMEAHLHPFWQRIIVPAIMQVTQALSNEVETQIIVATHSPLVLASVEPYFESHRDNLFHLFMNLEDGLVGLDKISFVKRGRVDQWLTSDIFGLTQPRSLDAENAIAIATKLQLTNNPPLKKVQEISDQLIKVLAPDDEFWPLWTYFAKQRGVRFDAR